MNSSSPPLLISPLSPLLLPHNEGKKLLEAKLMNAAFSPYKKIWNGDSLFLINLSTGRHLFFV